LETKQTDFESLNLAEVDPWYPWRRQQTTLMLVLGHFKLLLWFVKNVTPITVYVVVAVVRIGAR